MAKHPVFDQLSSQPRVQTYLSRVADTNSFSHAYLFIAPPGSLKGEASRALAAAALCEEGGCGECDSCIRVAHGTHPDVHIYSPEGATYMVDQIRDLSRDSMRAPIRGKRKIYILNRADMLGEAAASALLKTLEEPPADVLFILQGRSESAMLPTIVSRCQVVPFRRTSPKESLATLMQETGASQEEAQAALASADGVLRQARELLMSPTQWAKRTEALSVCTQLGTMDDLDVLDAAKALLGQIKAGITSVKAAHESEQEEQADFLGREAIKKLEQQHKRELTAREREGLVEICSTIAAYARDCVMLNSGLRDMTVTYDVAESTTERFFAGGPEQLVRIDRAIEKARDQISYNVSPQLIIERMLFDIREVLRCQK